MPEIVNCPQCERKLRVPEELLGKKVKCPTCENTFTASVGTSSDSAGPAAPSPPREKPASRPPPPKGEDFQFEDRPSRRPPPRRDEEDDDDQDDRPSRRRRDDDDEPIRRRLAPHRGGLVLTFGILSLVLGLVFCQLFLLGFGIPAWIMANTDIKEMRAGRMDREGESMTNIGRILGMVACGLSVLFLVGCLAFFLIRFVLAASGK